MYIPSYTSFDESNDDIQILQEDDNICVICWLPSEKNNKIKYMKDFSNIYYFCDCNVLIHIDCFNEWIIKCPNSPSCPICRTKITIFSSDLYIVRNYNKLQNKIIYWGTLNETIFKVLMVLIQI